MWSLVSALLAFSPAERGEEAALEALKAVAPQLHALHARARADPLRLAADLHQESSAFVALPLGAPPRRTSRNASLPVVTAHGMGDSCFNPGMASVTRFAGQALGVYSTCIPTADTQPEDTIAGFLKNMDASVDVFAERVRADPKLKKGFHAFGLSQGNNLIRGYIQKYNEPPVRTFMSICGINGGVAAFPHCAPSTPVVGHACLALAETLGALAYDPLVQRFLFQANYYREPSMLGTEPYKANSQLAQWNGEGAHANVSASRAKWAKTNRFVWVEATEDSMVYPREGEQWGGLPGDYPEEKRAVPMQEMPWYTTDAFGLRAAQLAGKNSFETFVGEHIRFDEKQLLEWLHKYFD